MSLRGYNDDTPALLSGQLSHVVRARVVLPTGVTVELDELDGTVDWDERRTPRVEARITCRAPVDVDELAQVDARLGARLVVDAGYLRPDGFENVIELCNLGLRSRRVSRPGDTMALVAQSDEALVLDDAPSSGGSAVGASTTAAITAVIQAVLPSVTPTVTASAGAAINESPLGDKWTRVEDLADRIDAKVYDDGTRAWFIAPTPTSLANPLHTLRIGQDGTITRTDKELGRDEWFNRVFLTHDWVDTGGTRHIVVAVKSILSGPYAATTGNVRTLEVRRETSISQGGADAAAQAMVNRTVTRGHNDALTAVSAYWLRPGDPVTVVDVEGALTQLVSTIAFHLRPGLMDLTTRLNDATTAPTLELLTTDLGNGTATLEGSGVTDNGDGTYKATSVGVTNHGNGTFTTTQ